MVTVDESLRKHFYGPDKALFVEKQLLIKGPLNRILRLTMDKDGNFFEHYNLSKKEDYKPVKIEKGDAVLLS